MKIAAKRADPKSSFRRKKMFVTTSGDRCSLDVVWIISYIHKC